MWETSFGGFHYSCRIVFHGWPDPSMAMGNWLPHGTHPVPGPHPAYPHAVTTSPQPRPRPGAQSGSGGHHAPDRVESPGSGREAERDERAEDTDEDSGEDSEEESDEDSDGCASAPPRKKIRVARITKAAKEHLYLYFRQNNWPLDKLMPKVGKDTGLDKIIALHNLRRDQASRQLKYWKGASKTLSRLTAGAVPDKVSSGLPLSSNASEPNPDKVGSGAPISRETAWKKRAFIKHCNEDVYARPGPSELHGVGAFAIRDFQKGTKLVRSIPGTKDGEFVVLTRREIETEVLFDEVKRLIYDVFQPSLKDGSDEMKDEFSLPAKGLNELPFHCFLNAIPSFSSNVRAAGIESDRQGYAMPEASRDGRKSEELLWRSHSHNIQSAEDYDFAASESTSAEKLATKVAHGSPAGRELSLSRARTCWESKAREIEKLQKKNAKPITGVSRSWRKLSADGNDVGKHGKAHFDEDGCWVDVRIKSFTPPEQREAGSRIRGMYLFEFNVRTKDGELVDDLDCDTVSVGDPSVQVWEDEA